MLYAVSSDHSVLSSSAREVLAKVASLSVIMRLDMTAANIVDFLASSRGLVAAIRALQTLEHQAASAAEDAERACEDEEAARWDALARACSAASCLVLSDYERAVWL
jgi:hypothetical protein